MKHYLELVPISARVRRKQSRMTRLCILFAVFLVSVIFGMADMEIRSQRLQAIRSDGAWHVMLPEASAEQAAAIAARPEVMNASWYGVLNYRLEEDYTLNGRKASVCGFDESFSALLPAAQIKQGRFPAEGEAAMTQSAMERLGLSIGDPLTLRLPDGTTCSFTLCGSVEDLSMLEKWDAIGVFVNTDTLRSLCSMQGIGDVARAYYVQFYPSVRVNRAVADIAQQLGVEPDAMQENVKYLGLIGQSRDSYMLQLYGTAAVLTVLVVVAGVLMITGSLNANVANRTEFFGLLRCLGATPRQVMRFVRVEALSWCAVAIPAGAVAAMIVVWGLCALLKAVSPGYFASMPAFGVSGVSILAGVLIGLATVLMAASKPARRASRVSPLVAVSGNAATHARVKRARGPVRLPVDIALGVHHALENRKSFLLMIGSYALSIVLFLAFTTAVDFLHHAIRPLKPYTPDLSIISADNSCSIPRDTLGELLDDPAVKRAYGRMFAYAVPVSVQDKTLNVNLISYESNQFRWAKKNLIEGDLASVEAGSGVLAVYDPASPLRLHDSLEADFGTGKTAVSVEGILSDSPFSREEGVETLICSEDTFRRLSGQSGYTILDIQLLARANDRDAERIRALAGENCSFSDLRLNNGEIRGAFYSFSIFIYGFLLIIGLISVLNIVNSIALSVSARMRQYGAMRAIGMSDGQLRRMVLAEAGTYALSGIVFGALVGVPINLLLFRMLITSRWGDVWVFPLASCLLIVAAVALSALVATHRPLRQIRGMSIVATIRAE